MSTTSTIVNTAEQANLFEHERPRLLRIAYGMLGTIADAEDAVQNAYLRFANFNMTKDAGSAVQNPQGWLTTAVVRLCLDDLRKGARQREVYVGDWLPEPVVEARDAEQSQIGFADLSIALLVVFDQLRPKERAAYLLSELFEMPFREVSTILSVSEANCRQMLSRARGKIKTAGRIADSSVLEHQHMVDRYANAIRSGDEEALLQLLAEDAVLVSDGGGKVAANLNPILGADRIMRFMKGLAHKHPGPRTIFPVSVNRDPGLLMTIDDNNTTVVWFEIVDGLIQKIFQMRNPNKLRVDPKLVARP